MLEGAGLVAVVAQEEAHTVAEAGHRPPLAQVREGVSTFVFSASQSMMVGAAGSRGMSGLPGTIFAGAANMSSCRSRSRARVASALPSQRQHVRRRRINDPLDHAGQLLQGIPLLGLMRMPVVDPLDAGDDMAKDAFRDVGTHAGTGH